MEADQTGGDIADFVTPRAVLAQLRAPTKRQVLQELARRAATMTGIPDKRIYDALTERERLARKEEGRRVAAERLTLCRVAPEAPTPRRCPDHRTGRRRAGRRWCNRLPGGHRPGWGTHRFGRDRGSIVRGGAPYDY